jgi:hypothetical protein
MPTKERSQPGSPPAPPEPCKKGDPCNP